MPLQPLVYKAGPASKMPQMNASLCWPNSDLLKYFEFGRSFRNNTTHCFDAPRFNIYSLYYRPHFLPRWMSIMDSLTSLVVGTLPLRLKMFQPSYSFQRPSYTQYRSRCIESIIINHSIGRCLLRAWEWPQQHTGRVNSYLEIDIINPVLETVIVGSVLIIIHSLGLGPVQQKQSFINRWFSEWGSHYRFINDLIEGLWQHP